MRATPAMVPVVLLLAATGWPAAQAQQQAACQAGPNALGVTRTIEVDTAQGPRFGGPQGREVLKDHEVVLTFDDGPHHTFTPIILDALDAYCTKATFFMVGRRALEQPEMVREVARRGHNVATHTWSHQNLGRITPQSARAELELGISAVQRALGSPAAPFFRFPYLSEPASAVGYLRERHTGMFSIDIDSRDYRTFSPTTVVRNVMRQLATSGKGIILMHDIQPATAGAIRTLLAELKTQGYKVVDFRPVQSQTTIAEFDQRLDSERRVASLPVSHRGVSSLWHAHVAAPGGPPEGAGVRTSRHNVMSDWHHVFGGN